MAHGDSMETGQGPPRSLAVVENRVEFHAISPFSLEKKSHEIGAIWYITGSNHVNIVKSAFGG
jgi:hypothetical protein